MSMPFPMVALIIVIVSGLAAANSLRHTKTLARSRQGTAVEYCRARMASLGVRSYRRVGPLLICALVLINVCSVQPVVYAAGGAGVSGAVNYATTHYLWAIYDNSLAPVHANEYQPQFQCAEFVARSLASAGPIGPLTPTGSDTAYTNVTYTTSSYNLTNVSGLFHFLIDTSIATDVGTNLSSATLGSVIIFGNSQDGDFLHTAIITDATNTANPLFTAHNAAYYNYPASTQMYDEYHRLMPITHILQINYAGIAAGAYQNSVGGVSGATLQMNAPAPYHGGVITSGIALSWQAVTGAQTYDVSLYDVNGRLIDGVSTASASFSYNLSALPYGIYDYIVQPRSSSASFPLFTDDFNYEPPACLVSGASAKATHRQQSSPATGSTSCGVGSGTAATTLTPTLSPAAVAVTIGANSVPSTQSITLTNPGTTTYHWVLGREPSWATILPNTGYLDPGASINLMVNLWDLGTFPNPTGTYSTVVQIYDVDNVYAPLALPVSLVVTNISSQWYFAEGYTGGSFTEYLTLVNPGDSNSVASVTVQYLPSAGTIITRTYYIPGGTRSTINVNTEVGTGKNVSMIVTSSLPIIAERPMYFTYTGLSGYTVPGGSDVLGATSLGTQFDFGYLDTSPAHATYLTILNPSNGSVTATVQYFAASGGAPITRIHTIGGDSRGTVNVGSEGLVAGSYSALVTLSAPGLVERPMYLVDGVTGYTGSANVVGVTQPLSSWYFAEGYTSTTFSERYILSNPSTSAIAHATVSFLKSNGTTVNATVTLSPGQQKIVNANSVLGNGVNNSATVTSDQPILAERFMSFTYTGAVGSGNSSHVPGATDVLGAGTPSGAFYFAEGYTGGSFGEYLTLENPNAAVAHVSVTYLPQNGATPTIATYTVNPTSRYTVLTNQVMPSQSFSMAVVADQPIVAERPMYFNYNNGQTGGSDVVGYQPDAPLQPSPTAWNIQGSPNPTSVYSNPNYLTSVAAVASDDVWAVGYYLSGDDPHTSNWAPLIEHWNGALWSVVSSPGVTGGILYGVAAVSANDVWAVGTSGASTIIEHWNGASWSIISSPNPSTSNNVLRAVSAVSANDIWATGNDYDQPTNATYTLTEHWNGTTWSIVSSPGSESKGSIGLIGVTTIATDDVWAVGYDAPYGGIEQTLTEHWNGSAWSIVSSPNRGAFENSLNGVAAVAADDIWAVGTNLNSSGGADTLIEHWDGANWTIVTSPAGSNNMQLYAVSVGSSSNVWAVGYSSTSSLIEHWDGANWTIMFSPSYQVDSFAAVAAISANDVWAVGSTYPCCYQWNKTFTQHYGS
jgi:putative amidase-like protein